MSKKKSGVPVPQPAEAPPPEVVKAALELVVYAYNQHSEVHTLTLSDLKHGARPIGSWEVSVRRID